MPSQNEVNPVPQPTNPFPAVQPQQPQQMPGYPAQMYTPIPSVPFGETGMGKWLKANIAETLSIVFLILAFFCMLMPVFAGQNLFYFTGRSSILWSLFLVFLVIIGLHIFSTFKISKIYPRIISVFISILYGITLGAFLMFVGIYSSVPARFSADYTYDQCKAGKLKMKETESDCIKEADNKFKDKSIYSSTTFGDIETPAYLIIVLVSIAFVFFAIQKQVKGIFKIKD